MVTLGSAFRGQRPHDVQKANDKHYHEEVTRLMMTKKQLDFQIDLLESALDLYRQAHQKKLEALEQGLTVLDAGKAATQTQAGGEMAPLGTPAEEKAHLEKVLGMPLSDDDMEKLTLYMKMRKDMQGMRNQLGKMTGQTFGQQINQPPPKGQAKAPEEEEPASTLQPAKAQASGSLKAVQNLPDWQKNPIAWTIWLLNWLVTARVLPGAYMELQMYAEMANMHNAQMNDVQEIEYELARLQNLKYVFPPSFKKYFTNPRYSPDIRNGNWWKDPSKGGLLAKELKSELSPLFKVLSEIKIDYEKYKNDPDVGGLFKRLYGDIDHAFGTKGTLLKGHINTFLSRLTGIIKGTNSHLFISGAINQFISDIDLLNRLVNAKVYVTNAGRQSRNPYWSFAFNNINNSGPWQKISNDFSQISSKLTNLSTTDQTNLREAFFSLTTKVNAASDVLTTVGQMLNALAQNVRSSA